jgi:branched-subunit amino acid ABC-type transport system permease component
MILINLIQFNVMHKIVFDMQHALFMVVTAFAIVITGGILRYKMITAGGILFAAMAYLSSYFTLNEQLLVESIAWFIAFVIPGHVLFSRRNK